jgi:hypothetical protein
LSNGGGFAAILGLGLDAEPDVAGYLKLMDLIGPSRSFAELLDTIEHQRPAEFSDLYGQTGLMTSALWAADLGLSVIF